ncbi:hypothetical protein [Methyloprofundus sp.]|uniref:hypothetical protein n=1 Tax=Methyloprofundus sp. TaxID=2020875 RepID=UPI003D0C500F
MIKVSLVKYRQIVLFALVLVLFQVPAFAKDITVEAPTVKDMLKVDSKEEVQQEVPKEQAPYDRLNRGTPRGSVMSFSESIKQGEQNLVMDFLDMRQVPRHIADEGSELMRKLGSKRSIVSVLHGNSD